MKNIKGIKREKIIQTKLFEFNKLFETYLEYLKFNDIKNIDKLKSMSDFKNSLILDLKGYYRTFILHDIYTNKHEIITLIAFPINDEYNIMLTFDINQNVFYFLYDKYITNLKEVRDLQMLVMNENMNYIGCIGNIYYDNTNLFEIDIDGMIQLLGIKIIRNMLLYYGIGNLLQQIKHFKTNFTDIDNIKKIFEQKICKKFGYNIIENMTIELEQLQNSFNEEKNSIKFTPNFEEFCSALIDNNEIGMRIAIYKF